MPVVPAPQTLTTVTQPYNVRSVSNADGFMQLGQGISNLGKAVSEQERQSAAKQKNKDANSAITESLSARTNAEYNYKTALNNAKSQDEIQRASEEYARNIEQADARISGKLVDPEVNQIWKDWSDKDFISRNERGNSALDKRADDVNIDSATQQVNQSAVDYTKAPSQESFDQFHKSLDTRVQAGRMLPAEAEIYRKTQEQQLHNDTFQNIVNREDYSEAKKYLDEHKDQFDEKTWGRFSTSLDNTINLKASIVAGTAIAKSAENMGEFGVEINETSVRDAIAKLPEEQQAAAKERAREKINEGIKLRATKAKNLFVDVYTSVANGDLDPATFKPDMLQALQFEYYNTLKQVREDYVNGTNKLADQAIKSVQDARSGSVSSEIHSYLDSLSPEDSQYAEALLTHKLNEVGKDKISNGQALTKTDYDALLDHAKAKAIGKSVASKTDIIRSVAEATSNNALLTDRDEGKKFFEDNPDFLSFVYNRTKGASEDNLQKSIDDSVAVWYTKTRTGDTLGDVIKRGDPRELQRVELSLTSAQVDAQIQKAGLSDKFKNLTPESKSRFVTQRFFQNTGVTPSYKLDTKGNIIPIPVTDILTGIRELEQEQEINNVIDDSEDPSIWNMILP